MLPNLSDTIVAIATPPGQGALGVIRLSGAQACAILQPLVRGKILADLPANTVHFVRLYEPDGRVLDETVLTVFRAPRSYTREDVLEISCHGSAYILNRVVAVLTENGARLAQPGEFTLRAFLNGALDLTQAEAVADLIAASSERSQQLAMNHLRGGFSSELKRMRDELVGFAALIELELDFGEEDVEFASRSALVTSITHTISVLHGLAESFSAGNAVKTGIATVIVGKPNAGKSTLLNRLLNENKAIVSATPGTTRDVIEDRFYLDGFEFRLIDTAGLRLAQDEIEAEGVRRSAEQVAKAQIILYLFDSQTETADQARAALAALNAPASSTFLLVGNKLDSETAPDNLDFIAISAKSGFRIDQLTNALIQTARNLAGTSDILLSSQRHVESLTKAVIALREVLAGLESGLSGELVALDLRLALDHIGEITGEVSSDEILGSVFSRFCIGK